MIAGTTEAGVQVASATTRTPAILGKKKAPPKGCFFHLLGGEIILLDRGR